MKRNPHSPKSQFVRAVTLVKGVHFYGFHASYSPFLKVHIADPAFVNRAVTILQSGTVMKTRFRAYESHLSYILQFMCDYGLYGCGWIDLGEVWERGQVESTVYLGSETNSSDTDVVFNLSPYFRQSRMPLEVDVAAHQIFNRHLLTARNIHHKITIPAPPLPQEPFLLSVRELWEDERRRRLAKGLSPSPEIPKDPSENSRGRGGEWVAEARWWEEIRKKIEKERGQEKELNSGKGWEKWVMTTFESVEALWEDEYKTWKPGRSGDVVSEGERTTAEAGEENPYAPTVVGGASSQELKPTSEKVEVDIDEAMLSSQAMEQLVEQEEEEWEKLVDGHRVDEEDFDERAAEDGPSPGERPADDRAAAYRWVVIGIPHEQRVIYLLGSLSENAPEQRFNAFQDAWRRLVR